MEKKNKYKDDYEERYKAYLEKKRRERQKPIKPSNVTPTKSSSDQNKIPTEVAKIEKEAKKDISAIIDYVKEPKHVRIVKVLSLLIPLLIIFYLLYTNFIISKDFNYFYDIGSLADAKKPYLTPLSRLSGILNESDINYRNATDGLVYFTIPVSHGAETVLVQARFKDNFPNNSAISIGASDNSTAWHYKYNSIYKLSKTQSSTSEWIINSTVFNIKEDNLSIKNSQLSLLFNIPHLYTSRNDTNTMHIPIDWINITVHKPGLIEQIRRGKA